MDIYNVFSRDIYNKKYKELTKKEKKIVVNEVNRYRSGASKDCEANIINLSFLNLLVKWGVVK